MEYKSSILINKPAEDVFALLSALDRFNDWLPPSPGYIGTDMTSELPVGKGSTYDVRSPQGVRNGVIDTFENPNRLVYKETFKLPIGGTLLITIEYTLSTEGGVTNLERYLHIDAPLLLKPVLKAQEGALRTGIDMFMKAVKEEVEKA